MAVSTESPAPTGTSSPTPSQHAPKLPTYNFTFMPFLAREYRFGLDPNRPVCKSFVQGHCPLGPACPDKHHTTTGFNSLVCKHWMRGLCKKGEACEFLHEYNLRKMPECNNFSRHGFCPNGDDCMYQHIPLERKRPVCPHFERGFCPLGPICKDRHVKRKAICRFYMAGFCPNGKECGEGVHARFPTDLKKPEVFVEKTAEEVEKEKDEREAAEQARNGGADEDGGRFNDREDRAGGPGYQKFGQRGGWQGKKKRGGDRGGFKRRGN